MNEAVEKLKKLILSQIEKATAPLIARIAELESVKQVSADDILRQIEKPKDGKDGVDGKSVDAEEVRKMIADEVAKVRPLDGKNGMDGRDALSLEIMPAIDLEKSYARGTYAKHAGGLWRSFETTHGLRGWECIVEGIASLEIAQDGAKGFRTVATLSSGMQIEKSIELPVTVYRGVFKDGETYTAGDLATWGGSVWHCTESTDEKPSENSKAWTLAVKKGRDGKDGKNGRDLVSGVSIK